MDVRGDLPQELFAINQVSGTLEDPFSERAIPPGQASDEQERYRCRVGRVDEVTPISIDRAAKPLFVDSLQRAWLDGREALRHGPQQGRISFAHGPSEFIPEDRRRMPKFGVDAPFVQ